MKSTIRSTTFKAVLASIAMLGMRIPVSHAQALFFGAFPEQVTTYNSIAPAAGPDTPVATTTSTTVTTASSERTVSLAPPVPVTPPDSIDSRLNTANDVPSVPNGARSDN